MLPNIFTESFFGSMPVMLIANQAVLFTCTKSRPLPVTDILPGSRTLTPQGEPKHETQTTVT